MSTFVLWYDDSKKPTAQKIANGIARYQERFRQMPDLVLVNEVDFTQIDGIRVEVVGRVRPNNFQIGMQVEEGRG